MRIASLPMSKRFQYADEIITLVSDFKSRLEDYDMDIKNGYFYSFSREMEKSKVEGLVKAIEIEHGDEAALDLVPIIKSFNDLIRENEVTEKDRVNVRDVVLKCLSIPLSHYETMLVTAFQNTSC